MRRRPRRYSALWSFFLTMLIFAVNLLAASTMATPQAPEEIMTMMMDLLRSDAMAHVRSNGVNMMNPYYFRKGEAAVVDQQLAASLMDQVYAAPLEDQLALAKQSALDNDNAGPYMVWDAFITGHVDLTKALNTYLTGTIGSGHWDATVQDYLATEIDKVLKMPPEGKTEAIEKFLTENPNDGSQLLFKAAVHGDETMLDYLIEAGHEIHPEKSPSIMPLHAACYNGRLGAAQRLVSAGIDVNHLDEFGGTPLMRASSGGRTELVRWLVENGADAKTRETRPSGSTALELGVSNADVARLLLDHGAEWSPTAFASAIHHGNERSISIMSDRGGFVHFVSDPAMASQHDTLDDRQREAILLAIRHCASAQAASSEILHWLLRHVAISNNNGIYELDPKDEQLLESVRAGIRGAIRNDDAETVRVLISSLPPDGIAVGSSDDETNSDIKALEQWLVDAVHSNAKLVTRMLLEELHIDPNAIIGPRSETPLAVAAMAGHVEMIKLLVSTFGASIHKASGPYANGPTPLWHAIRSLKEGAARALLDLGGAIENMHAAIKGGERRLWLSAGKSDAYRAPVTLTAWISPDFYDDDLDVKFICLEFDDGFNSEVKPRNDDDELLAAGDERPLAIRPEGQNELDEH